MLFILLACLNGFVMATGISSIDSLKSELNNTIADTTRVNLMLKIGNLDKDEQNYKTPFYFYKALILAQRINYPKGISEAYLHLGEIFIQKKDFDSTIYYIKKSLEIREKYSLVKNTIRCYVLMGGSHLYKGEYKTAHSVFDMGIKYGILHNEFLGLGDLLKNKGIVYAYSSEYKNSINCFIRAIDYYEKADYVQGLADCYTNIGVIYNYMGNHKLSIDYQYKATEAYRQVGNKRLLATALTNLGVSYDDLNEYNKALEYYTEALAIRIEIKDKSGTSVCYNNIGEVYKDQGEYAKAVEFYEKSLVIDKELDDDSGMAICLLNIGNIHFLQSSFDKAHKYYNEALDLAKKTNEKRIIANVLNSKGELLLKQELLNEALIEFKDALKVCIEIGERSEEAKSLHFIGEVNRQRGSYADAIDNFNKAKAIHKELGEIGELSTDNIKIGESWLNMGYPNKAIGYCSEGFYEASDMGFKENIGLAAEILAKAYAQKNNFEKAYHYATINKQLHDSLFTIESQKQIHIVEHRFELERKEQEIELQKSELKRQDAIINQRLILQRALLVGIALTFIIVILVIVGYVRIRRAKNVITLQKNQIEDKNEELHQGNEELRLTVETVNEHKERIEKTQKELTDSIQYAQYIQNAILPHNDAFTTDFIDHFVLYKPKDIVSGDFYWTTKIKDKTIVAAADCTGHGVPGAFMSMLGVSFLNDIVNKAYITDTSEILQRMRSSVIFALQQKGVLGEQRDGMDMAIVSIDFNEMKLQFSGAHNHLYIIRKKENLPVPEVNSVEFEDRFLYEIKADAMPIALYEIMNKFEAKEIPIYKGDQIYMFSDGFTDQFGGSEGKRFKSRPFKETLLKNCHLSMYEQKQVLEAAHNNWKNIYEQIDDIMVLGLTI